MNALELIKKLPEPYRSLALKEIENVRAFILETNPKHLKGYDEIFKRQHTHLSVLLTEIVVITTSRDFFKPDGWYKYQFWLKVGHAVDSLPPIPEFYQ